VTLHPTKWLKYYITVFKVLFPEFQKIIKFELFHKQSLQVWQFFINRAIQFFQILGDRPSIYGENNKNNKFESILLF